MQESDLQELQKEPFVIILALVTVIALSLAYVILVREDFEQKIQLILWLPSGLMLATCAYSYNLYRKDQFRGGTYVFIGGLIIAITTFMLWPDFHFYNHTIYLLTLVVAMAGLLINPKAAIQAANFAVVITLGFAIFLNGLSWAIMAILILPLAMAYAMAIVSGVSSNHLTTTLQWAMNSQARAQQRSLELFESQQELQKAYQMQETTNIRLKEAEAAAVQANQFKTRFIANLSHELRTPLSAIINFSFVLSKNRRGEVSEEQRDYLNRIHDSGDLLLEIVNDLLDLAKIEAGQMELFQGEVDLAIIGKNTMTTISGLTTNKMVKLHLDIPPDLPIINGDKTRIRQILLNLLGNAAKYTDEGSITLKIRVEGQNFVKISVIDTGIGIREQDFERIFEEFQQTQEAFDLRKVGTGLGLPITKNFIELHGGQIWIESEYKKGSTFHFTLPITPNPENSNPQIGTILDKVATV